MMGVKSVRIPEELEDALRLICQVERISMSEALRRALLVGSEQILIERAIDSYVNGGVDLNTAARYAGVSVRRMMSEMERRNVRLHQPKEMAETSIQSAAKLFDQPKLLRLLEED